jgi:hypothetical protein
MQIHTFYLGDISIEPWEFAVCAFYALVAIIGALIVQKRKEKKTPEFRYFTLGLACKVLGGFAFAMIYVLYYGGGDTIDYYASALAYVNLMTERFDDFVFAYFHAPSEDSLRVFTSQTGEPLSFIEANDQTRMVTKVFAPLIFLGMKSYLITTLLVSIVTYYGLWKLYRLFCFYFPKLYKQLALTILFMPSVAFWGSGILKDSITLMGICLFLHAVHRIIQHIGWRSSAIMQLIVSIWLILGIKPYILIILLPGGLIWYFHQKIMRIRYAFIRVTIVPFILLLVLAGSYLTLTAFGEKLGKFSLDRALETAVVAQQDLKKDYYQGNAFDIGPFDASLTGVLSKFPAAAVAGFFRPFIFEVKNVVMLFSATENLVILIFTLTVIFRMRYRFLYRYVYARPVLFLSLIFSVLFAFMIGLTTSNFGALVRFKIPLIPLYMSSLIVMIHAQREERLRDKRTPRFAS